MPGRGPPGSAHTLQVSSKAIHSLDGYLGGVEAMLQTLQKAWRAPCRDHPFIDGHKLWAVSIIPAALIYH